MNKLTKAAVALVVSAASFASTASAEIIGVYLRNGDEFVLVRTTDDGVLYCTRVGDGFEMCDGLAQQDDGTWTGNNMKHPDMPAFMKFTGHVEITETDLLLEGCTLGNSQCESESWPKQ